MPNRDLANRRVTVWLGAANAIANLAAPAITEINAMLMVSAAIRWDGFDFGAQESDQVDDRSLDDDAGAVLRGFAQFGGAIPFFMPKKTDTSSILRTTFNLVKTPRTELLVVERVGFKSTNQVAAAGDIVNVYRILTDGFNPDTEGDGGYAYIVNFLPKGDIYPWTTVPAAAPASITLVGGATLALTAAGTAVGLRGATYQGFDLTSRATWVSSAPNIATVDSHGIIQAKAAGSASITATYPGATASTACTVTVT